MRSCSRTCAAPRSAPAAGWTTKGSSRRSTPAARTSSSNSSPGSAGSARPRSRRAAASACPCPSRRSNPSTLDAGVGLLRTLPAAPESAYQRLHRVAHALGVEWPATLPYPELIRSLDPARPNAAAFLAACTGLLRGAGYRAFDAARGIPVPADPGHAALAAPYAHCTAPLRRLADRYTQEICVAVAEGTELPAWVSEALPGLPALMESGDRRAREVERACVDLVEAELLRGREGEAFDAVVIDIDDRRPGNGTVQLREPAVVARCDGGDTRLPLGERIRVRLTLADPATRTVRFAPA